MLEILREDPTKKAPDLARIARARSMPITNCLDPRTLRSATKWLNGGRPELLIVPPPSMIPDKRKRRHNIAVTSSSDETGTSGSDVADIMKVPAIRFEFGRYYSPLHAKIR